jgi:hypothetical protein
MKHITIAMLLLMLTSLALIGCAKQEIVYKTKYVCPDKSIVEEASLCQQQNTGCNFPADCPGGYCDVDAANPENNHCVYVEPKDYCGNGVCEASYGENAQSCARDCP